MSDSMDRMFEMYERGIEKKDAEIARLRRELREAEEAIRSTPLMLDVSGWPMERGAMEWMMLPAVRRARGREGR